MVLVCITAPMGEDQVWIDSALHFLKKILHLTPTIGQEPVSIVLENGLFFTTGRKQLGSLCGFLAAESRRAENHPVKPQSRKSLVEIQQGSAAPNLDIVGMRT